ncbi:(2Fe-2S)-binding protein [Streptomyces sp. TS71-3]|uniref:(2Fe-2S)-binding protein n=1 Tax=Streptomyces sp. TS71-3 TaxID=2733862 RepID=UPI001B171BF3|nr:(2Fe-2S)-binding protein [Streptomyces sp. TS71-3]GHJ37208.1 carbon-monoxide dehydrogenase small subunit [Streptomyces sp. TS71-3]
MDITVTVNGKRHDCEDGPGESLLFLLRERLGLIGPKNACEQGECGSCSVWLDGLLVNSCLVLSAQADGCSVRTVEDLAAEVPERAPAAGAAGALHPVQQAFIDAGAVQCGFCTPGMVVTAVDLLARSPRPSAEDVRREMAGNICRCTGYQKIVDAVLLAAERMAAEPAAAGPSAAPAPAAPEVALP